MSNTPTSTAVAAVPHDGQIAITPMGMLERAVSSGADVAVMERLMELHERWQANQARVAFSAAITALRFDIPPIIKSRQVDFSTTGKGRTQYKYEDLAEIVDALSEPLAKHGITFRWRTDSTTIGAVSVTCIIEHEAGHVEETTLSGPYDNSGSKNAIQAIGSVVTYLQRYTLKAALGIAASQDDDGRQGTPPGAPPPPAPPTQLNQKWLDAFKQWREALGDKAYLAVLLKHTIQAGQEGTLSEAAAKRLIAAFKSARGEANEGKPVEQAPEPEAPDPDAYQRLCAGYKAHLGEDAYHRLLAPYTGDGEGKSNTIGPEMRPTALQALHTACVTEAPEGAPFPASNYWTEACSMKKTDLLESIAALQQGVDGAAALRTAYLGEAPDKALQPALRVYHARLSELAWAEACKSPPVGAEW